jgi:Fe-S cluster biosynthesis and repair protein YggX
LKEEAVGNEQKDSGQLGQGAVRMVHCAKFGEDLPGLAKPPFPGAMGKTIFDRISARAWTQWREDMQIKVLNEYRLNMSDPNDHKVLMQQMLKFLNLEQGGVLEVENAERGRKDS